MTQFEQDSGDGAREILFPDGLIHCVVLGAKTADRCKALVERWCHSLDPAPIVLQAQLSECSYGVEIDGLGELT